MSDRKITGVPNLFYLLLMLLLAPAITYGLAFSVWALVRWLG